MELLGSTLIVVLALVLSVASIMISSVAMQRSVLARLDGIRKLFPSMGMKIAWRHADGPGKHVYMDVWPSNASPPLVGDILSGKPKKPGGRVRVYEVTARRFHPDWNEWWIFVRATERK